MLYGFSFAWLPDKFPDLTLPTAYESILSLIAVGVACLSLLWVLVLRGRLAKSRLLASSEGTRYRQLFDNSPDALLVVEIEGCIVSANPRACELFQMDGQDLLAHTCWDFIDPVSLTEFRKRFQRCLHGKPLHCEAGIRIGNDSFNPVEINGSIKHINERTLILLHIRDQSAQWETEAQVRSLYNQLEKASAELEKKEVVVTEQAKRDREKLLAYLNHRIRTPLDGIMGMGQLLSESTLNIDQYHCVNTILDSSTNLLQAVDSIIKDPESLREEPESEAGSTDLRSLCNVLSRSYDLLAVQKGIEFRCNCHDNVPTRIMADGELLSQILSTLLDNAFRFTTEGLVMLNVECRRQSSEEAEVYFQVIDTGPGIDRELKSPDSALSTGGKNRRIASGVGIDSCRRVVKQMGGTFGQTHTAGKGSTAYFHLTFKPALPHSGTGIDEQPPSLSAPASCSLADTRVLVVDDNKISQKVVAAMLQKAGAEVNAAGNGKEALSRIRETDYDVVLMDCQMPVMDGHEATRSIRSLPEPYRSIPVIALTAHSLKHELQACLDSGMDDCLVKPIERQNLIDIVTRYKNGSHAEIAVRKAS